MNRPATTSKPIADVPALALAMLDTLEKLSQSRFAKIDAAWWHKHYQRQAKKLGLQPPVSASPRLRVSASSALHTSPP